MAERVVVTGMGVVAANAHGLDAFEQALRDGRSGIRFHQKLRDLGFACQVGGVPEVSDELKHRYFSEDSLRAMNSSMVYAGIAAIDCWRDAGFAVPEPGGRGRLGHRRHHRHGHRRRGHGRRLGRARASTRARSAGSAARRSSRRWPARSAPASAGSWPSAAR